MYAWPREDRNQKFIIALLNYREFSFTKIDTFIINAFLSRPLSLVDLT